MAQEADDLRQRINQFTTGNVPGYERVALQVMGMLGHGKSSLVNSCVCVVNDEEYHNVAGAGSSDGGLTISRHEHRLTDALVMVDNRGFQKLKMVEILEACAQLRSLRDLGVVTWEKDNLEVTLARLPSKFTGRPADFMLPVLVFSASYVLSGDNISDFEKLITQCFRITGLHPIVVITNCTTNNGEEIRRKFGTLGVMKKICLENYTENNYERTEEKDRRILEFITMCVQEAERGLRMRQNEDPQTRFVTQATEQIKLESSFLREMIPKSSTGNLRPPSTVDWEFELERTVNQLEERCSRNSMDFMVPVLVYSLDSARLKNVVDEFGPLLRDAFEITGIFPIVVLTRYTCSGSHVNNARKSLEDLGSQHVVLLNNYTTTNSARRPDTDSTVLKFLHLCLQEADRGIQRRQNLNVQCGLLKQAAEQIRAEMRRQKEKEREERGRQQAAMEEAEDRVRKKEAEISHKEGDIASLNNQIQSLNFRLTPNTSGGSLFGQTATFGAR